MSKQRIMTTLWFDNNIEEAVNFYVSVFKNSKVHSITPGNDAAPESRRNPLVIHFQLDGQDFLALNGGPQFKFTEAISLTVYCDGQKEVDEYWNKLLAGGGQEVQCGWIKDRYGLSWQIVPTIVPKLLQDKDPQKRKRVMEAVLRMKKLNVDALQRAHDEESYATASAARDFS
ncbi:MAG TPA: VOC family protein [Gemmatimonadales bacterium]|nr:VOC family protein [Gemmatimonadales bacterium]